MNPMDERGTGRTTRLLKKALADSADEVVYIVHTQAMVFRVRSLMEDVLKPKGIWLGLSEFRRADLRRFKVIRIPSAET